MRKAKSDERKNRTRSARTNSRVEDPWDGFASMAFGGGHLAPTQKKVPPRRFERLHPAPEAGALSTELRGLTKASIL
jgi:hypothetical protein